MTPTILVAQDNTRSSGPAQPPRSGSLSRHRLSINPGFALARLLSTWTGWCSYRESLESRKSAEWVAHTRGEVRIGLEAIDGMVRVTVSDNGPGSIPRIEKQYSRS